MADAEPKLRDLRTEHRLTVVLKAFAAQEDAPSLGTVLAALGGRAHAMALLVLVLPETVPLPLPSISAVLGIPLIAVAAHLLTFGEGAALPVRLGRIVLPTSSLVAAVRYAGPTLGWLERVTRPRWVGLAQNERVVGAVCLWLAVILFLPLPFVNLLPALCIAVVAFGAIQRDGIWVAMGMVGAACLTGALLFAAAELIAVIARRP